LSLAKYEKSFDLAGLLRKTTRMKQRYHTIIKPSRDGWFVGWVEEVPGTITGGRSLDECRRNLRDSLMLMIETNRDEARIGLDNSCIQESIEVDVLEEESARVLA
jgi:predicted RNase H-like HicB family nuclease